MLFLSKPLTLHGPASEKDVDIAVAAARNAFRQTWGKNVSGFERSGLIHKLADLMERDKQILAELECLNNGKPVKIARCIQVPLISANQTSHTSCFSFLEMPTLAIA